MEIFSQVLRKKKKKSTMSLKNSLNLKPNFSAISWYKHTPNETLKQATFKRDEIYIWMLKNFLETEASWRQDPGRNIKKLLTDERENTQMLQRERKYWRIKAKLFA